MTLPVTLLLASRPMLPALGTHSSRMKRSRGLDRVAKLLVTLLESPPWMKTLAQPVFWMKLSRTATPLAMSSR